MALGSLNLRVSKSDFNNRITTIESKMQQLQDVIQKYGDAKNNLDQFIAEGDSTYESMIENIDANIDAAKKAWTTLQEMKKTLSITVEQMEGTSTQVERLFQTATETVKNVVGTALKVQSVL